MTKAYTIARLIREVSALNAKSTRSFHDIANALSPREGTNSVKVAVLDSYLNFNLISVIDGHGAFNNLGKTPRTRVLKALKARANGTFTA